MHAQLEQSRVKRGNEPPWDGQGLGLHVREPLGSRSGDACLTTFPTLYSIISYYVQKYQTKNTNRCVLCAIRIQAF